MRNILTTSKGRLEVSLSASENKICTHLPFQGSEILNSFYPAVTVLCSGDQRSKKSKSWSPAWCHKSQEQVQGLVITSHSSLNRFYSQNVFICRHPAENDIIRQSDNQDNRFKKGSSASDAIIIASPLPSIRWHELPVQNGDNYETTKHKWLGLRSGDMQE